MLNLELFKTGVQYLDMAEDTHEKKLKKNSKEFSKVEHTSEMK